MKLIEEMIQQVDQFIESLRLSWMYAPRRDRPVWMKRINAELDARLVLMGQRDGGIL